MKWKYKPTYGTRKIIKKFALLPIFCKNGEAAWFESVFIVRMYTQNEGWINVRFADSDQENPTD